MRGVNRGKIDTHRFCGNLFKGEVSILFIFTDQEINELLTIQPKSRCHRRTRGTSKFHQSFGTDRSRALKEQILRRGSSGKIKVHAVYEYARREEKAPDARTFIAKAMFT